MIDVDHLRELNSTHGHVAGDRALVAVAEALRRATRDYDVAARFGGDEFCVLLPETDMGGAMIVAERMRARVEEVTRADDVPVTISIGVVSHQGAGPSVEGLILAADTAAYQAKASGRNAIAAAELADPVREAERVLRDSLAVD
jgi:diguanylate cyclase (GGDEF)-like protein